jgi:G:T-mismatch repair DNA endonuclease (very short patch repair protein)
MGWTVIVIWECVARSQTALDQALAPLLGTRSIRTST